MRRYSQMSPEMHSTFGGNFNATIELLNNGQRAALITLTDERGEWAGYYRIDGANRYERGYDRASQEAALKGGRLNSYRRVV